MDTSGEGPLRVVVIEDHPMMLTAVVAILRQDGMDVVGTATTATEGYDIVGSQAIDAAVVDLRLPDESGVELTRRLLQRNGRLAVVVHTGIQDAVALKDALGCGARALAYKTGGPEPLLKAVRTAAAGGAFVAPELRAAIVAGGGTSKPRTLTDRERQVLSLVADGLPNDAISDRLMLSTETVRTHVRNAMRKLGVHTRAHAVVEALRNEEIGL